MATPTNDHGSAAVLTRPALRFLLITALISLLASCTKTVYVRMQGICPKDPSCLADGSATEADRTARELEFRRRAVASSVDISAIRHLTAGGRLVSHQVGAFVSARGYILTSAAGLRDADTLTVTFRVPNASGGYTAGASMSATPLTLSTNADVALLVVGIGEAFPPSFPIRFDPVIAQDRIWSIGGGTALASGAVVATEIKDGEEHAFAESDMVLHERGTGAPVLNVCGEVVGIVSGPGGKRGYLRFMPIDTALLRLNVTRADLR